jgi:hypothetical protein
MMSNVMTYERPGVDIVRASLQVIMGRATTKRIVWMMSMRWTSPLPSLCQLVSLNQVRMSSRHQRMVSWKMLTWLHLSQNASRPSYPNRKTRGEKWKIRSGRDLRVAHFFLLMLMWMTESYCRSLLRIKNTKIGMARNLERRDGRINREVKMRIRYREGPAYH